MTDIEWKTYIEPVKHKMVEVTEENVLAFCRQYGWALSYIEKKVPPHPDGRATIAQVHMDAYRERAVGLPFWVELRYDDKPVRVSRRPQPDWKVVD